MEVTEEGADEEEEDDVEEEVLAVDFRLGFPASGFNAVSRGPYSFKEAVFVWKKDMSGFQSYILIRSG